MQAQQALREELTRVIAELAARGRTDNFYSSLAASFERYGSLTERQEAALRRSLTQYAERQAERAAVVVTSPMPQGRVEVTGTVLSTKYQESNFGGCHKMLVQSDAGWKVWGTIPSSLGYNCKGLRVSFTATVEPKEAAFGFFSRPSKANVIEAPVAPAAPALVTRPADIACTNVPTFVSAKLAEVAREDMAGEERRANRVAQAAAQVVATANRLDDIIAKAKALEAQREAADRASGGLASEYWDTDSMAA
jgi:hypothetical protein